MVDRETLINALNDELAITQYSDYCPNGLQIQGVAQIQKVMTGVTASQHLIDQAVAWGADLLLVHHGYFWKGEDAPLVGMKYRRIKTLLEHDINLAAYHLPLDAHLTLGNNAQLAKKLGFIQQGYLSDKDTSLGFVGELSCAMSGIDLSKHIANILGRSVTHISVDRPIKTVGWCTGAGQRFIDVAAVRGLDAFISGEISEPTAHSAREQNIHYFAAGHHATERYGVQALGDWLAQQYGISHRFYDDDNPA